MKHIDFKARCRNSWRPMIAVFGLSLVPIGIVGVLHIWKGVPIDDLTRDPIAVLDAHLYVGFLSQLGIFGWAAAGAVCVFAAGAPQAGAENGEMRRFLYVSSLLTLVLGFDDVFLMHEQFFPYHLGVPEKLVYAGYGAFVLYFLTRFRITILATEYPLLLLALTLFATSILSDLISGPMLFEDGAKFAGIIAWATYFFRTARSVIAR